MPEGYGWLFIASEIVITLIVFIGVYYIFKPVFKKEAEKKEES